MPPPSPETPTPDSTTEQVLLSQKSLITNADSSLSSWVQGTDYCTWSGVTCSGTDVTQLQLSGANLEGTLSEDLGNLGMLQTLNLAFNALSGPIPGSWAYGFKSLMQIDLKNNQLSDVLPPSWGSGSDKLPTLQSLDLSNNNFNGALPLVWGTPGGFPSLSALFLNDNDLAEALPAVWGASGVLVNLNQLNLANNNFTGTLPDNWGNDGSLQALGQLTLKPGNPLLCGAVPSALESKIQPTTALNSGTLTCDGQAPAPGPALAPAPGPADAPVPAPAPAPEVAPAPAPGPDGGKTLDGTAGVAYLLQGTDLNPWDDKDGATMGAALKAGLGAPFANLTVKYLGNVEESVPSASRRRLLQAKPNSAVRVYYDFANVTDDATLKNATQTTTLYSSVVTDLNKNKIVVTNMQLENFNPGGIVVPKKKSGLSKNAKIGIAIGAAVVAAILLIIIVVLAIWCKCCGGSDKPDMSDEPLMKVPPIPGGGSRSFRAPPSPEDGALASGDNYYRRQPPGTSTPAGSPMPAPIILDSGNAQFQGRNLDGSIDDTQAGAGGKAQPSKFSSWWSGRNSDTEESAVPAVPPPAAPVAASPSGGKVAEWLKPSDAVARSPPSASGKKKLSELVGDIDTI